MPVIGVVVTARDEAAGIAACLRSLLRSIDVAHAAWAGEGQSYRLSLLVVLDDCRDATPSIVADLGVPFLRSTGGKVEAQRTAVAHFHGSPFLVFCDGDVTVTPETLGALCAAMSADPALKVAFPPKHPLPPRRRSPLAWASFVYNARRGFSRQRTWFSGKLFAIRGWHVPGSAEIERRARTLPPSAFLALAAPLRVDDIFLSRSIVAAHGPAALAETSLGAVFFRAPETLRGMYLYHRRMRRELERTDRLFPELSAAHRAYGTRRPERATMSAEDHVALAVFELALLGCRARYRIEHVLVDGLGMPPLDPWPAIAETK